VAAAWAVREIEHATGQGGNALPIVFKARRDRKIVIEVWLTADS
jgi:hypothetical protein